ncbi:MAG: protein kinase [Archangium sp.]|nr:protein kinase [Archangium sp.]MDP3156776.1 protein kinase [Archangium sp.]MDP3574606.1 protein kinase [Archangium sp.]
MSLVGRHIGRYRILEQLGQGGMSVVYKGLDTTLDREVAVKVLHPHLAGRAESRKRLEREAKAVARLHHPNILEVFDYSGETAADAFLVTEYIRGQTLRQFITEEALQPPEVAAMVVHELASALAHAHEAGILHRDLKPENVMVREDGLLKLMDFGIAKILDRDEKMTMTGALVGSPAHMAPEIIEGEEAGAEADVFSLGTMLYLFATGKLPFVAPNTTATLKRILDCVYDDPRQVVPTVSDELAEIIGNCLQRQPANRFPTAAKLRDALADYLATVGLTRPHEELTKFFLEPRGYRKELTPRITSALLAQAEKSIAEKKSAKAMSALNQVLAHEPSNSRANELLGQMRARKQREARVKRMRRLAFMGGAAFIVAMSAIQGVRVALRPLPFVHHFALAPTDVTLASVAWPRLPEPIKVDPPQSDPPVGVEPVKPLPMPVKTYVPRPTVELLEVALIVRPFGYLQVDDGPRSVDALARHVIKLPPGPHRFTVTCDLCETQGRSVTIDISKKGDEIPLVAPLKPSLVSFQGWPDDAKVRVGAIEKTVKESQVTPFRQFTPPSGNPEMRHKIEYTVSVGGEIVGKGVKYAAPGKPLVIEP